MKKILLLSVSFLLLATSYAQQFSLNFDKRPPIAYVGLDNPITCTVAGVDCNVTNLSTTNGTIKKVGGCSFNFRPTEVSDAKIIILKKGKDSVQTVGETYVMVREIPDPIASVGGLSGGTIKKEALNAQGGLAATAPGYLGFDLKYNVKSFAITAIRNKELLFFKSVDGNAFSAEVHKLFDTLQKDDIITFSLIKVLKADGREGRAYGLDFVIE